MQRLIKKDVHSTGWSLYLWKSDDSDNAPADSLIFEHNSCAEPFLEISPEEIDSYCDLLQACKIYFINKGNK